jgi:hypothetical protein
MKGWASDAWRSRRESDAGTTTAATLTPAMKTKKKGGKQTLFDLLKNLSFC